jgi:hypothetical protein
VRRLLASARLLLPDSRGHEIAMVWRGRSVAIAMALRSGHGGSMRSFRQPGRVDRVRGTALDDDVRTGKRPGRDPRRTGLALRS